MNDDSTPITGPLGHIDLIKYEIEWMENEMTEALRRFHERRTDLLWRLNTLQASTRVIPPEILGRVFSFLRGHGLQLVGVCSNWRQVALATPQLWSSLCFFITSERDNPLGRQVMVDVLQFYLENVKDDQFSLTLQFDTYFSPSQELLQLFSNLLLREENIRKVYALQLVRAPSDWIFLFSELHQLGYLEIRDLISSTSRSWNPTPPSTLFLVGLPRLHRLELHDLRSSRLIIGQGLLEQITHISLSRVSVDLCIALLTQCPNLIHFQSIYPRNSDRFGVGSVVYSRLTDIPIVLCRLRYFGWECPEKSGRSSLIYPRLRFPNLSSFHWWSSHKAALEEILPNLPPSLSSLTIHCAYDWVTSLAELVFRHTSTIQNLRLYGCNSTTVTSVLEVLEGDEREGRVYLPHLGVLSIDGIIDIVECHFDQEPPRRPTTVEWVPSPEIEAELVSHIAKTLRARRNKGQNLLLEVSRWVGSWSREIWDVRCSLHEEGIEMKLWMDSEKRRLLSEEPESRIAKADSHDGGLEGVEPGDSRAIGSGEAREDKPEYRVSRGGRRGGAPGSKGGRGASGSRGG